MSQIMTILQALKRIKHLDRKITTSMQRISQYCSYLDTEAPPMYDTSKLEQSINDMLIEKGRIRHLLHEANINTKVNYKGKTYSLDDLLILSTIIIPKQVEVLNSYRRKEKNYSSPKEAQVLLQYDPKERDEKLDRLAHELDEINSVLDEANITVQIEL